LLGPFKYLDFQNGSLCLRYDTDPVPEDSWPWDAIYLHKNPLTLIGICHCPSESDLSDAYTEFLSVKSKFPKVLASRCFAFEPMESQFDSLDRPDLILFPNQDVLHLRFYLSTIVSDIATTMLESFEAKANDMYRWPPLMSNMDAADPEILENSSGPKWQTARREKHFADLSLLAGSPVDASEHYRAAHDGCQNHSDWVWAAASLEGTAAAIFAEDELKGGSEYSSDVVDMLEQAGKLHAKRPMNHQLRVENLFRLATFHVACNAPSEVSECLLRVQDLARQSSALFQITVLTDSAVLLSGQRLHRKAGFVLRMVAELYRELRNFDAACRVLELVAFKFNMLQLHESLKSAGLHAGGPNSEQQQKSIIRAGDAKADTFAEMQRKWERGRGLSRRWVEVQKDVLDDLIDVARQSGDLFRAAVYTVHLLQTLHPWLERSSQRHLAADLFTMTRSLPLNTTVDTTGIPELLAVHPVPLQGDKAIHSGPATVSRSFERQTASKVFLFTPSKSEKDVKSKVLNFPVGEVVHFEVHLANPLAFELVIQRIAVSTSGALFEAFPETITLAPSTKSHRILLSGKPLEAGTFSVRGCHIRVFNMSFEHRVTELGIGLPPKQLDLNSHPLLNFYSDAQLPQEQSYTVPWQSQETLFSPESRSASLASLRIPQSMQSPRATSLSDVAESHSDSMLSSKLAPFTPAQSALNPYLSFANSDMSGGGRSSSRDSSTGLTSQVDLGLHPSFHWEQAAGDGAGLSLLGPHPSLRRGDTFSASHENDTSTSHDDESRASGSSTALTTLELREAAQRPRCNVSKLVVTPQIPKLVLRFEYNGNNEGDIFIGETRQMYLFLQNVGDVEIDDVAIAMTELRHAHMKQVPAHLIRDGFGLDPNQSSDSDIDSGSDSDDSIGDDDNEDSGSGSLRHVDSHGATPSPPADNNSRRHTTKSQTASRMDEIFRTNDWRGNRHGKNSARSHNAHDEEEFCYSSVGYGERPLVRWSVNRVHRLLPIPPGKTRKLPVFFAAQPVCYGVEVSIKYASSPIKLCAAGDSDMDIKCPATAVPESVQSMHHRIVSQSIQWNVSNGLVVRAVDICPFFVASEHDRFRDIRHNQLPPPAKHRASSSSTSPRPDAGSSMLKPTNAESPLATLSPKGSRPSSSSSSYVFAGIGNDPSEHDDAKRIASDVSDGVSASYIGFLPPDNGAGDECMLILDVENTANTSFRLLCSLRGDGSRMQGVFVEKLCSKRVLLPIRRFQFGQYSRALRLLALDPAPAEHNSQQSLGLLTSCKAAFFSQIQLTWVSSDNTRGRLLLRTPGSLNVPAGAGTVGPQHSAAEDMQTEAVDRLITAQKLHSLMPDRFVFQFSLSGLTRPEMTRLARQYVNTATTPTNNHNSAFRLATVPDSPAVSAERKRHCDTLARVDSKSPSPSLSPSPLPSSSPPSSSSSSKLESVARRLDMDTAASTLERGGNATVLTSVSALALASMSESPDIEPAATLSQQDSQVLAVHLDTDDEPQLNIGPISAASRKFCNPIGSSVSTVGVHPPMISSANQVMMQPSRMFESDMAKSISSSPSPFARRAMRRYSFQQGISPFAAGMGSPMSLPLSGTITPSSSIQSGLSRSSLPTLHNRRSSALMAASQGAVCELNNNCYPVGKFLPIFISITNRSAVDAVNLDLMIRPYQETINGGFDTNLQHKFLWIGALAVSTTVSAEFGLFVYSSIAVCFVCRDC
jgi:Transport protein Trs120 or TRAPPC9, TRAPP II complex subunit